MLLTIDAGNTNTVFAVFDGDAICGRWRIATNASRTAEEYVVWLSQLMGLDGLALEQIHDVMISTVVPEALFNLQRLAQRYFKTDALHVGGSDVELGVAVRVDRPAEVGADRKVNALAAHEAYGGPAIVLDFGTATTFDCVDTDGAYIGGVIAPGINLSLEALHMASAQLPRIALARPGQVIGKSTVPCMQSGVYWGYIGLIEGLVKRIRDEFGAPMKVIATGGLATPLSEGTDLFDEIDQDLTLKGLKSIYWRNRPETLTA